ncbi:hypothetical protein [Phaeobacter gallaeciensis]|uniref:Uncharacterized protein n=1 Tax=Phaeobacter gallaeciensis TaxID=60890 RepID=A0AAD0ECV0_9RHOB|nr:hypothetical protein [Phaeobacter gallaeciensis]AHD09543.1 hypothetical protein Gal_01787 [Phaeobacter gallaeciensis DSM 26640]ATE92808.1 hypothetical protein PhaeoP11_01780 [Phaeobacter gallaeciensis]ATE97370.1 hypothetical protein PhaeoP73_02066 [Phaeobacter gallaeciensis]ATF01473.1 hypothetical protein PhaeoP75_01830 [Phaeobacter gallaeciensis]ATF05853.1 hypothetical protein PhaeoP63_01778 [Phaeobacter gallaeciensis]
MTDTVGQALTTSSADVFTVPAGKVRHVTLIQVCNVDGTNAADATIQWTDASNSDAVTRLAYQVTVEAQDSRTMSVGALALAAGDKLQALASAASDLEMTVTYYDEDAA